MKDIIEALLFASPEPLTQAKVSAVFPDESVDLRQIVESINSEYETMNKALFVAEVGGGYQILTKPEYQIYVKRLFSKSRKLLLTRPALEALAVVAYRQPVSKLEIESIRGVNCDSVIRSLLEREMITIKGRDSGLGRALLYGTTRQFLEAFGLNSVSDLPKLKELSELVDDEIQPTEQKHEIE